MDVRNADGCADGNTALPAAEPVPPRTAGRSSRRDAGSCSAPFRSRRRHEVSDATDGANQIVASRQAAQLLAQATDVDVHAAIEGIQRTTQGNFRNLLAGNHVAGIAQQQLKNIEFHRGYINRLAPTGDRAGRHRHLDIAHGQEFVRIRAWRVRDTLLRTTQYSSDTGHK